MIKINKIYLVVICLMANTWLYAADFIFFGLLSSEQCDKKLGEPVKILTKKASITRIYQQKPYLISISFMKNRSIAVTWTKANSYADMEAGKFIHFLEKEFLHIMELHATDWKEISKLSDDKSKLFISKEKKLITVLNGNLAVTIGDDRIYRIKEKINHIKKDSSDSDSAVAKPE